MQDVQSLKKERPRKGKRKPIEKDEDEEDAKKNDLDLALADTLPKGVQEKIKRTFLKKRSEILTLITFMVEAITSSRTLRSDTMKKPKEINNIKEKNSWTSTS